MEASREKILCAAIGELLRPRRFPYLYTLWRELRSAVRRTELARRRGTLNHGIQLHHRGDHPAQPPRLPHNYQEARTRGIERLFAIRPEATLSDLQFVCELVGPKLFAVEDHMSTESASDSPGIEATAPVTG